MLFKMLLPLSAEHIAISPASGAATPTGTWDYLYEPEARVVMHL